MMKKYIPFAESNIWSARNGSMLSLQSCDRFIGCLEQEVTSQILHRVFHERQPHRSQLFHQILLQRFCVTQQNPVTGLLS